MKIKRATENDGLIKIDGGPWVRVLSAREGRCFLTGDPVRVGDRVYIPQNAVHQGRPRILARWTDSNAHRVLCSLDLLSRWSGRQRTRLWAAMIVSGSQGRCIRTVIDVVRHQVPVVVAFGKAA